MNRAIFLGAFCLASAFAAIQEPALATPPETKQHHDARMAWWRDARFGMFIHWGLYAVPAGTYHGKNVKGLGEWIMYDEKIPVAEYETYAKEFNPVKFDAERWVSLAKAAGMKYIVITAKHCDGFAMYPSKASKYNLIDATPFARRRNGSRLAGAGRASGNHRRRAVALVRPRQKWQYGSAAA